jgi:excinuclease ABC subunit C
MIAAAQAEEFDKAALLRDRIRDIEASQQEQHVVFHDQRDVDAVGVARSESQMAVSILTLRNGRVIGKREILCELTDEDHAGDMLENILSQHYLGELPYIPPLILTPIRLPSAAALQEACQQKSSKKVEISAPQRGARKKLLQMAIENASVQLAQAARQQSQRDGLMDQVAKELRMPSPPQWLEAYDISNIQGTDAVGSQVTFVNGEPAKALYRKYKIRTVVGANDFAMLQEVLGRRFKKDAPQPSPQLVLIDGGKGQLNAAGEILRNLGVDSTLASIAKVPDNALRKSIVTDRIFVPGRKNPLNLRADSPVLRLFQRMRDEAHRFALSYHHKTKGKAMLQSGLVKIPGVGAKRQRELLRHFGSLKRVRMASLEELRALPFLNAKLAEAIHAALRA